MARPLTRLPTTLTVTESSPVRAIAVVRVAGQTATTTTDDANTANTTDTTATDTADDGAGALDFRREA